MQRPPIPIRPASLDDRARVAAIMADAFADDPALSFIFPDAATRPERLRRFDDFVRGDPFSMTLLIRLLPVGSNLITNLVAGVSSIRKTGFFAGSFVGYLPQALIFALAGDGLTVESHWRIGSSIVLFLLAGLLALPLYRRMRHGQTYDEALEVDEPPKA